MGKAKRTKKHKTKEKEETTKITRENLKRKQDDKDMDFSHSDSTTNLNTQSESWECPLSAKKHIIPDSMNISSARRRRASLRSSKRRLIETGLTALSRCSQPQKSRQHSSPTLAIQQLDHLAYQVPDGSDLVEFPSTSRYRKQVAHPLTTMTMEHEETEKVGDDIPLPVPEMMEEVGEKEEPLAEPIQNSMVGVGVGVGCPSPSFSLKLTELVNMVDDDDDEEVDSVTQTVEGYEVKPEFTGILRKILIRHGDIAKKCTASTMELRSALLEMICGIISELQGKDLRQIKEDFLRRNIALVNGIKNMEVDIEWLRLLLVEMLEAKEILEVQCGKFKEVKENNRKTVEDAERKLAECRERKKELSVMFEELSAMMKSTCDEESVCKETLAMAKDESTKMTRTIKEATSKVKRFLNCSPVDYLLL